MQQTDKYKLNKPGVDDPIAIAPLNENAEKIEAALTAETEARQIETAALDQRVSALEVRKIAVGSYVGNGLSTNPLSQTILVGFTPKAVILPTGQLYATIVSAEFQPKDNYCPPCVAIVEGGFQVMWDAHLAVNHLNTTYPFVALA